MVDVDIRNTSARLRRIALAASIGAIFTWFTMRAIADTGHGQNSDPIGGSMVPLLAIFTFVLTTSFAHKIISKKR